MKKTAVFIACGTGMGADAAKHLSSKGYDIAIMSSSGKGEKLANDLGGLGFTGSNLITNDIENFIEKVLIKFGKIDVLINSAGHGPKGDILQISDEEWIKGMEMYFLNVVKASRIITPTEPSFKLKAKPLSPPGSNSTISPAWTLSKP